MNLKKWYTWTCLQGRDTDADIENGHMDMGEGESGTNWESSLDIYLLSPVAQLYPTEHARLPCSSPTPRAYSNSCLLCWWCHTTISSSLILFSSRLQSFPASGSFSVSQFFTSGGQSIGVSASTSVLPVNIQDSFPLGWTGCIYLLGCVKSCWIYMLLCVKQLVGSCSIAQEAQLSGLWWPGGVGWKSGKEAQEGPDICGWFMLSSSRN